MSLDATSTTSLAASATETADDKRHQKYLFVALFVLLLIAPFMIYPFFLMKVLCFALFACAFNLLLGYGGLLSFGHAAYFGMASYVSAHAAKVWGATAPPLEACSMCPDGRGRLREEPCIKTAE